MVIPSIATVISSHRGNLLRNSAFLTSRKPAGHYLGYLRIPDPVGAPRLRLRVKREAHSLMPPFLRMNRSKASESSLYAAAYLITRDHLLRVRLLALAGSAVARMTEANGSSRSDPSNLCRRGAWRARSISRPSAVHQTIRP